MIAGESEYLFDQFVAPPESTEKDVKSKKNGFFSKLKNKFKEAGGIEGVSRTVGNVAGYFHSNENSPMDYEMRIRQDSQNSNDDSKEDTTKKVLYIVGGIILVGGIVITVSYLVKKNKQQNDVANVARTGGK